MSAKLPDFPAFLQLVIEALHVAGIEYLVGGAVAAWAWGEPRATQDLDLVIDLPVEAAGRLSAALEARDMRVPVEMILDTLAESRADIPINAIHTFSGLKADLYPVRAGDALWREAFQRRQQVDFGPPIGRIYIHSPEDLVIYKLLFFSLSQQTKHARDIAAILRVKQGELDLDCIEKWVQRLGLGSLWDGLRVATGER